MLFLMVYNPKDIYLIEDHTKQIGFLGHFVPKSRLKSQKLGESCVASKNEDQVIFKIT